MLTQNRLKEVLNYDAETGIFTWLVVLSRRAGVGTVAGANHLGGYRSISIDGSRYLAHRLAILYTDGYMPEGSVDHINRIRNDNRRVNLREASRQCQLRNSGMRSDNTSGIKGVRFDRARDMWNARIYVSGSERTLGRFDDILEAAYHRFAAEACLGYPDCDINSSAKQFIEKRTILDHWVAM